MKEKKESLLITICEGLLVGISEKLSRFILGKFKDIKDAKTRLIGLGILALLWILVSVLILIFGKGIKGFRAAGFLLVYLGYLILSAPFFIAISWGTKAREDKLIQNGNQSKRIIYPNELRGARLKDSKTKAFLGTSFWTKKPFYLTDEMRNSHAHVVGSTGVGKTESVLLPLLSHDIQSGKGAIVIDAKGDLELLARIREIVTSAGRDSDFLFFSLSHPEISNTYNPLLKGNASEIKDKLIGATEWREEFYRKKSEEALLTLLRPMVKLGMKIKFRDLYRLLTSVENLKAFRNRVSEGPMYDDLEVMERRFHDNHKFLSGLIADLALVAKSEFARLVDSDYSEINLLKVYEDHKIVYFSLNTQGYEETAKRFGRLILQDIKTVSNEIQTQKESEKRHFFPVFVDEFSSFVYENFIEFLNKGRGAGFAITLLHQSLADLATRRSTFQQQILENTNIKIIMRQDDPFSIDKFAKIGGAKKTIVSTYQTEEGMLGTGFTGQGSIREGETFRIDPDLIRKLGVGEAIVVTKSPTFEIDYLKLDYQNKKTNQAMIEQIRKEKEERKEHLSPDEPGFRTLKDKLREIKRQKN